ncbi:MAG: hypothetical protein L3J77_04535, partial [Thermoplasmata archaeon]|nr:hypothetical protein [Thermoplasmata archaeon]
MAVSPKAPPDAADYLDRQVLLPGLLGVFLIVGAGLLWAGTHGAVGGYLALFWGGILALVLGVALVA